MVLDATGHARKLVEYDKPFNPGYQVMSPCSCISETRVLLERLVPPELQRQLVVINCSVCCHCKFFARYGVHVPGIAAS